MKLSHYYYLHCFIKFVLFALQISITLFFLYWTFNYCKNTWNIFVQPIFDLMHNSGQSYDYHTTLDWVLPILKQLGYLIGILLILGFFKHVVKNYPISKSYILKLFRDKEISPLFANIITKYYVWQYNLSHDKFFQLWKDAKYQQYVLEKHQQNREFYQFLIQFEPDLQKHKPLPTLQDFN